MSGVASQGGLAREGSHSLSMRALPHAFRDRGFGRGRVFRCVADCRQRHARVWSSGDVYTRYLGARRISPFLSVDLAVSG